MSFIILCICYWFLMFVGACNFVIVLKKIKHLFK